MNKYGGNTSVKAGPTKPFVASKIIQGIMPWVVYTMRIKHTRTTKRPAAGLTKTTSHFLTAFMFIEEPCCLPLFGGT